MCRQGAPALVASPLPIQPYATFSCRTARHHAVDRPGRWRGRQRGAQQDQRSERRLDCHHRGVGIAVTVAVYAVASFSGAHLNPAVTIGLASIGKFAWAKVPVYIAAQLLGALLGAAIVWLAYLPHWPVTESPAAKLAVFCTAPAIRKTTANLLTEVIGTFVLVLGVLAILTPKILNPAYGWDGGFGPFLVGILVWAIGLSLGGPTGYAINPARDLGPRLAHAVLPVAGKGNSDWGYAWIPIAGPVIGGLIAAFLYRVAWSAT